MLSFRKTLDLCYTNRIYYKIVIIYKSLRQTNKNHPLKIDNVNIANPKV